MVVARQPLCRANLRLTHRAQHTLSPYQLVEEFPVAQVVLAWMSIKELYQLEESELWLLKSTAHKIVPLILLAVTGVGASIGQHLHRDREQLSSTLLQ